MLESLYWQQLSLTRASWISQWSTKTLTFIGTTPGFESQWRKICMSVQRWALIPFPTHFKTMEAIFETPLYVNTLNVYFGVGQKWTSYTIAILFTFYCNNNITLTHSCLIDIKLHVIAVFWKIVMQYTFITLPECTTTHYSGQFIIQIYTPPIWFYPNDLTCRSSIFLVNYVNYLRCLDT